MSSWLQKGAIVARICLIRQFYYPLDIRVRREVEALIGAGHEVDVICLRRPDEPARELTGRLRVHRVGVSHRRGGVLSYLTQYGSFFAAAMWLAGWKHLRRRYDIVQVNSMPDALVFAAMVPRLLGARVVLDLHECMPEFLGTKFGAGPGHPAVRVVGWLEQASIRFADAAITCTDQQREAFVRRGASPAKIGVILNAADESVFDITRFPPRPRQDGTYTLICHGSVEAHYGLDTVIRAVALLKDEMPELRFEIYGDGTQVGELRRLALDLGVQDQIYFSDGYAPMDDLLQAIASADAGVVAMKRDAFRDLTHCNKMYDFIAMGKPALLSRTRSVEAYFTPESFAYFTSDDPHDLAAAIRRMAADPERAAQQVKEASRVNEPYRWPHQRERYLAMVQRLLTPRRRGVPARAVKGARP